MLDNSKSIGIYSVLALFLFLGLSYSYYTPLWTPPDEERHFVYCEYIARNFTLPDFTPNNKNNIVGMGFHPPLYYFLGSLFCKNDNKPLVKKYFINDEPGFNNVVHPTQEITFPYSSEVRSAYLIRLLSIVLSAVTVWLIYFMVLEIWPDENLLALAAAFFVATIPQFLHISASISNENLATTVSTAYLLSLMYYLKNTLKLARACLCGILLGCCLLSKTFTIFYLPVTICIILLISFRTGKNILPGLLIILTVTGFVSGWWFIRNWTHYHDPLLSRAVEAVYPWFVRGRLPSLEDLRMVIETSFYSFFGYFGALQFTISTGQFYLYGALIILGICGLLRLSIATNKETTLGVFQRQMLGMLLLSLLSAEVFFVIVNIKYKGMFLGRYLYPVIAPIAVLLFTGLRSLIPFRLRNPTLVMISLVLLILNLDVLFRIVKPAYANTGLEKCVDQPEFCCSTPQINKTMNISQTFLCPKNNLSAIRIMISHQGNPIRGELEFILREVGANARDLYRIPLQTKTVANCTRYLFVFPPIKDSMGKRYSCYFSSPSQQAGQGISLWYASHDNYHDGLLQLNGNPSEGDLYFQAYCFTGERPETDWQGRKATVIEQGWYVTIRELQLYNELSKDLRERTETHTKLLRLERALNSRSATKH